MTPLLKMVINVSLVCKGIIKQHLFELYFLENSLHRRVMGLRPTVRGILPDYIIALNKFRRFFRFPEQPEWSGPD